MRVAYDMTIASVSGAGIGTYAARVATTLAPLLGDQFRPIAFAIQPRHDAPRLLLRAVSPVRDLYWWPYGVERAARRSGADVLHIPNGGFGPARPSLPVVLTVHDIIVLRFPEFFRSWARNYVRVMLPKSLAAARMVVTSSDASRAEILERFRLEEDRVLTVSAGVDPEFAAGPPDSARVEELRRRFRLPDRFVLTVGATEPRKNLPRLLRAVHQLRGETETKDLTLVHAGPAGWLSDDVPRLLAELQLAPAVRFLGYVPRADLPALYAAATLLAYPSIYEGFGLPVLEAMSVGCPVVTSDVSSLPEVAGGAAILVDPMSVEAIADGVRRSWGDAQLRETMRCRGTIRAAAFDWGRVAQRTLDAYARAVD